VGRVDGDEWPQRIREVFGLTLRDLREERGLTQEHLSFKAGLHRTYVGLMERGLKSPTIVTVVRLANALDMKPSAMLRKMESSHPQVVGSNSP
jgi:transcriptional regulator with XRE-family HTH domain